VRALGWLVSQSVSQPVSQSVSVVQSLFVFD
jgi:hypothetical protein